ncbi:MAG: Holliday junction branch migration protein RuvA [Symbiobacteriaceae bacterium]
MAAVIAFLRGQLAALHGDEAWIDVGGVGYRVAVSRQTQRRLPPPGGEVFLRTRLIVREDQWALYGFATAEEQAAFDALLAVSGVGPRLALAILSVLTPEELHRAVALQDAALLTRVPGVGPKLARRLLNELRDRLGELPAAGGVPAAAAAGAEPAAGGGPLADALAALEALGYTRSEAEEALVQARTQLAREDAPAEAWIREALRALGRRNRALGGTHR